MIQIKRLSPDAQIPTQGTPLSAGLDLYSLESVTIPAGERKLISTGIAMALPQDWVGIVKPRSSMAVKGITTDAGVIDADYRGELRVLLVNTNSESVEITLNQRVAQLVVVPHYPYNRIEEVTELDDTDRGQGGFGSTGQ